MVNTCAAQSGGCRFESLWGFGFSLKGAYYEVGYCGKKTFLAGLQCTLTSSCAKRYKIMMYTNTYQSKIQKGQGMSINALRVLAPRTNYDEMNIVFTSELRKKLKRGVCYQQYMNL